MFEAVRMSANGLGIANMNLAKPLLKGNQLRRIVFEMQEANIRLNLNDSLFDPRIHCAYIMLC